MAIILNLDKDNRMKNFFCLLFGHRYFVAEEFSFSCRKVGCHRCPSLWGMHDRVKAFLPWDSDLAEARRILKNEV